MNRNNGRPERRGAQNPRGQRVPADNRRGPGGGGVGRDVQNLDRNGNNENPNRERRERVDRPVRPLSYTHLSELIEKFKKSPNDLLMSIQYEKRFYNLITNMETLQGKSHDFKFLCNVIKAFSIIIESDPNLLSVFLSRINENAFEMPIIYYLTNFKAYLTRDQDLHLNTFDNLVQFIHKFQIIQQRNSRTKVSMICTHLNHVIEICNKKEDVISQRTVSLVKQITEEVEKASEDIKVEDIRDEATNLIKPPDDFRDKEICPTVEDIHQRGIPFLRSNIKKGKYIDVDHYLDIQFRLLREDFVRPLREGITEYRNAVKEKKNLKRMKDIRVYTSAHIGMSTSTREGLIYEVTFDATPFQKSSWQYSKRLIFGSMLCLSSDNFETFCFATVAGKRDPEMLSKGKFKLQFETQSMTEEFKKITSLTTLTIIESQAYYEAFRHILSALQRFTEEEFPLKQYLIRVSTDIKDLPHLDQTHEYDLSDLIKPLMKINTDEFKAISDSFDAHFANDDSISLMDAINEKQKRDDNKEMIFKRIRVIGQNHWPNLNDSGFDESQYEAYKAALTKQMVVIQGPPGTGKTYVGLRIVQTLVRNNNYWNLFERPIHSSPILVVCYTNHALDQFLEGMIPFVKRTNGIIRIGGRSQSEFLEKYSLLNLKRQKQSDHSIPEHVFRSISNCRKELEMIQKSLSLQQRDLQKSIENFIGYELIRIITDLNANHEYDVIVYQLSQLRALGIEINGALLQWLTTNIIVDNDEEVDEDMELDANEDQSSDEVEADEEEIRDIENSRAIDYFEDSDIDYDMTDLFVEQKKPSKKIQKQIKNMLENNDMMDENEVDGVLDIFELPLEDRWRLYRYWRSIYCREVANKIEKVNEEYSEKVKLFNRLKVEEDLCALRGCEVIGLTTTGAAKYRILIEQIDPYIVVVEEAAEVLESHIVTALTKNTKHLILIGDHQQLKPNPTVYELAKKYNLETSLFERLINNGLPYYQLKVQHRMRPNISSLLVPHIYKELRDHESVKTYENIKGVTKNMFFINHTEIESKLDDNRSKLNKYESEFIVRLCRYLILQEYKATQITILTMYSAQLIKVKKLIKEDPNLKGVRAAVLDNYQGEECDIILISFVRSNIEGDIGFLKVKNRVNVALSRAKMGLYCIGNFELFSEKSEIWKNILNDLKEQNSIGPALELICQNHQKTCLVSKGSDFSHVPEGGCEETCNTRLDCGHVCPRSCHIYDRQHKTVKCMKYCHKTICELNHRCPDTCHFPHICQPCGVPVMKRRPKCGHNLKVKCSMNPNDADCRSKCDKSLICGHQCTKLCSENCSIYCNALVSITGVCGHKMKIKCCKQNDIESQLKECPENCGQDLECGHLCGGSCGECYQKSLHKSCRQKCERTLICGHICLSPCGQNCPPCKRKCKNECLHSVCTKSCGTPCSPCQESCKWQCEHIKCQNKCCEPCDRDFCAEPCNKRLKPCRHQCIGICGEKCPTKCRICDKEEVEEILFGDEDEPNARFVQLEDCGHVIEFKGLVQWLAQKNESNENIEIQMKSCPKCKTIIRKTKLFNTTVQQTLKDIELIKIKIFGKIKDNMEKASELLNRINDCYIEYGETPFIDKPYHTRNVSVKKYVQRSAFLSFDLIIKKLISQLSRKYISRPEIFCCETKFEIISQLIELKHQLSLAQTTKGPNHDFFVNFKYLEKTSMRFSGFIKFIDSPDFVSNNQQRNDTQLEMNGLSIICQAFKQINEKYFNQMGRQLIVEAFDKLYTFGPFSQQNITLFKSLFDKAIKLQGGLGISLEEKNMIMKVMSFGQKGHWYKCPNGHIYCIGDCGGATQVSRCPECGAQIGGSGHRLLSNNSMATEMDGGTRPAYGPYVPFDPQQFMH